MKKNKSLSKFIVLFIALAMIVSIIPVRVWANGNGQNENNPYTLTFAAQGDHQIDIVDGHLKIDGAFVDLRDGNNSTIGEVKNDNGVYKIVVEDGVPGTLNYNTDKFTLYMQGHPYGFDVLRYNEDFLVQDYENPQGGGGQTHGNTNATVTVSGGEGSYTTIIHDNGEDREVQIPYAQSYIEARISINDSHIEIPMEEQVPENYVDNNFKYNYSADDFKNTANEGKVRISFGSTFNFKYNGTVKVNNEVFNVADYINYTDRENWLDHYNGQMTSFDVFVTKADSYNIVVNLGEVDENSCFIGNFLWTANPDEQYRKYFNPETNQEEFEIDHKTGERVINDDYIGNAKIQLMKIVYERNGHTITRDFTKQADLDLMDKQEREFGPDRYCHDYTDGDIEYSYTTRVDYDEGSLVVPEGATVTMKIVPNYGYQVTAFSVNGGNIIVGDNISEFSFVIQKGNFHLGAKVEKVEDVVKAAADGIVGGTIKIAENEIDSGSVRLLVNNTEPSQEKVAEFENNLAEGYQINGFVNISLDQVFFKATGDDVWAIEKENLENEASISLELEDEIDPENTIIVHNIHDGEEFEEVEYEYDAETKTLRFKTKSFSNYALATKTSVNENAGEVEEKEDDNNDTASEEAQLPENNENSPQTGDVIRIVFVVLGVAVAVLVLTLKFRGRRK